MEKYRKKPVVIEAEQWNGRTLQDAREFASRNGIPEWGYGSRGFVIVTLEGEMAASRGDFIIKGVSGEFYPCKPDIFEKTYERVD